MNDLLSLLFDIVSAYLLWAVPFPVWEEKDLKWIFQLEGNFPMTAGNSRVMSTWTDVHMLITANLID